MRELEKYQKTEAYKHFTRKVQEKQKGKRHRGGEIGLEKQQGDKLASTTESSSSSWQLAHHHSEARLFEQQLASQILNMSGDIWINHVLCLVDNSCPDRLTNVNMNTMQ